MRLVAVVRQRRIAPLAAGARLRLARAVRGRVGAGLVSLWGGSEGGRGYWIGFWTAGYLTC